MILSEENLNKVLDMLDKESMTAIVHDTGIEVEFLWDTDRFATFVPYGYDVTVNEDGYPEVIAAADPGNSAGWF